MKIAIVGTGIAGLSAAYVLSRAHEVELFDANTYAGGHTNTVDVGGLAVDTGFIVHNRQNYPLLNRLFGELGVKTRPTAMSFSMSCGCGTSWSSRRPWRAGRLLIEIQRFLRTAGGADVRGKTFDEFLSAEGYSERFRWHYLVPMTSALWSTAPGDALQFPAELGVQFFRNHGMLGFRRQRWRTVVGGSQEYVRLLLERIGVPVHLSRPVGAIDRHDAGVTLRLVDGSSVAADAIVIATHAPTALELLARPTALEEKLLAAFAVTANEAALHTDVRFLPRRRGERAAWNYQSPGCGVHTPLPSVTYSMNRLQGINSSDEWCLTLNRTPEIDPHRVTRVISYAHPRMTLETLAAQARLHELNHGRTAFAGAWQGFGFHEDGIRSGVAAARSFGVSW